MDCLKCVCISRSFDINLFNLYQSYKNVYCTNMFHWGLFYLSFFQDLKMMLKDSLKFFCICFSNLDKKGYMDLSIIYLKSNNKRQLNFYKS